jgi:hypothetical protein
MFLNRRHRKDAGETPALPCIAPQTDDSGRFNFPQLKPGVYSVTRGSAGFRSRSRMTP